MLLGTGGSGTTINVGSTTGFPSTGTNYFQVGTEEISYTGVTATSLQELQEQLEVQQEQRT